VHAVQGAGFMDTLDRCKDMCNVHCAWMVHVRVQCAWFNNAGCTDRCEYWMHGQGAYYKQSVRTGERTGCMVQNAGSPGCMVLGHTGQVQRHMHCAWTGCM
jgi:hypothetical protein